MKTTENKNSLNLEEVDLILQGLSHPEPPAAPLLKLRQKLSAISRPQQDSDVMTLEEVGKLLRLSSFELDSIMRELPVFELAGKIRVRRQRLFEWIESREKANAQASIQSAVEKSLQRQSKANVA